MTPLEHAIEGLTKKKGAVLEVKDCDEKGRGVFASATIQKGSFICEYETNKVYPRREKAQHVMEYEGVIQFGTMSH